MASLFSVSPWVEGLWEGTNKKKMGANWYRTRRMVLKIKLTADQDWTCKCLSDEGRTLLLRLTEHWGRKRVNFFAELTILKNQRERLQFNFWVIVVQSTLTPTELTARVCRKAYYNLDELFGNTIKKVYLSCFVKTIYELISTINIFLT